MEAAVLVPAEDDPSAAPVWRPRNLINGFWSRLELLAGASAFGVATLVEREREGRANFQLGHELDEIGQAALIVTSVVSFWKQWHPASLAPRSLASGDTWQMRVRPARDKNGVALLTTFKRRF